MGRTLYDTIYLGRRPLYRSRHARIALMFGVAAIAWLGWMALGLMN